MSLNENEINKLMTEVLDYSAKLRVKFNSINDIMYDTINYYDSNNATDLRNSYNLYKSDLELMISNIMSYNTDLANLKSRYKSNLSTISDQIKKDAADVIDKQW